MTLEEGRHHNQTNRRSLHLRLKQLGRCEQAIRIVVPKGGGSSPLGHPISFRPLTGRVATGAWASATLAYGSVRHSSTRPPVSVLKVITVNPAMLARVLCVGPSRSHSRDADALPAVSAPFASHRRRRR